MYTQLTAWRTGLRESRINASAMPPISPSTALHAVTCNVISSPSRITGRKNQ